jgi:alcohol dehydrogenase (cytochrome c)
LVGVPFVELDWAKGLTSTGRPILSEFARIVVGGRRTRPGADGGTNWQNPAFDQKRGLIFVPATLGSAVFTKQPPNAIRRDSIGLLTGSSWITAEPSARSVRALDAATGRQRWEYSSSPSGREYSGLLSTDGGLVFGAAGGVVFALDADTGREVWRVSLGGDTKSAPISFAVDGRQVIAIAAGRALFVLGL